MTVWVHELVKVTSTGNVSLSLLKVEDEDTNLTSGEVGVVYTLDGAVLPESPPVDVGSINGSSLAGGLGGVAMHFRQGGNDYYMLPGNSAPGAVTGVSSYTSFGGVGGIAYIGYGFIQDGGSLWQGEALTLTYTGATFDGLSVNRLTVFDDDGKFHTDGSNGLADTEIRGTAMALFEGAGSFRQFNVSDAGTANLTMVEVRVNYTANGGGTASFDAILWDFNFGLQRYVYILPKAGTVDMADVASIDNYVHLGTAPSGETYETYGLTKARVRFDGAAGNDVLTGGFDNEYANDDLRGLGGADILIGRHGQDRLDGGAGGDTLLGGHHDDILIGGNGNDSLFGGLGNDVLRGGKGRDRLDGGWDEDRIEDGNGKDRLFGGAEADTFVLVSDGVRDFIKDFEDGLDKIDVAVAFSKLTITDIASGKVKVQGGGDTLIVEDEAGLLTAADLTATDFV